MFYGVVFWLPASIVQELGELFNWAHYFLNPNTPFFDLGAKAGACFLDDF